MEKTTVNWKRTGSGKKACTKSHTIRIALKKYHMMMTVWVFFNCQKVFQCMCQSNLLLSHYGPFSSQMKKSELNSSTRLRIVLWGHQQRRDFSIISISRRLCGNTIKEILVLKSLNKPKFVDGVLHLLRPNYTRVWLSVQYR